jgi:hypothetical protein
LYLYNITMKKYQLKREHDGLTKEADKIAWVEWNDKGYLKKMHDEPAPGRSLMLDPQYSYSYTWLTTEVAEIQQQTSATVQFRTKNSTYTLTNNEAATEPSISAQTYSPVESPDPLSPDAQSQILSDV